MEPLAPSLHVGSTETLAPDLRREIRALLDTAFPGDFSDEDWAHALGGVHVWLARGREVISHGALVERTIVCDGRTLSIGYVEAVATAPSLRQRGHGSTVMRRLGDLIQERYALGALSTGAHAFYAALGWERWRGPSFVAAADGTRLPTPDDDGGIMVLRTPRSPALDFTGGIVCHWRSGAVW